MSKLINRLINNVINERAVKNMIWLTHMNERGCLFLYKVTRIMLELSTVVGFYAILQSFQ